MSEGQVKRRALGGAAGAAAIAALLAGFEEAAAAEKMPAVQVRSIRMAIGYAVLDAGFQKQLTEDPNAALKSIGVEDEKVRGRMVEHYKANKAEINEALAKAREAIESSAAATSVSAW